MNRNQQSQNRGKGSAAVQNKPSAEIVRSEKIGAGPKAGTEVKDQVNDQVKDQVKDQNVEALKGAISKTVEEAAGSAIVAGQPEIKTPPVDPAVEAVKAFRELVAKLKASSMRLNTKDFKTEDIPVLIAEMAAIAGMEVKTKRANDGDKRWKTAQDFFDHMKNRTDKAVEAYNKNKDLKAACMLLIQKEEFEQETVDFSPKGKERLRGEQLRMVRRFAKDTKLEHEKVIKEVNL